MCKFLRALPPHPWLPISSPMCDLTSHIAYTIWYNLVLGFFSYRDPDTTFLYREKYPGHTLTRLHSTLTYSSYINHSAMNWLWWSGRGCWSRSPRQITIRHSLEVRLSNVVVWVCHLQRCNEGEPSTIVRPSRLPSNPEQKCLYLLPPSLSLLEPPSCVFCLQLLDPSTQTSRMAAEQKVDPTQHPFHPWPIPGSIPGWCPVRVALTRRNQSGINGFNSTFKPYNLRTTHTFFLLVTSSLYQLHNSKLKSRLTSWSIITNLTRFMFWF